MLDYLYYKLYRASLMSSLKDIPHILASLYFGGLISINILVLYLFLVKLNILPSLFTDAKQGGFLTALMISFAIIYYRKDRRDIVLHKYLQESEKERKKGNVIVAIYITISILLTFVVAFYNSGNSH